MYEAIGGDRVQVFHFHFCDVPECEHLIFPLAWQLFLSVFPVRDSIGRDFDFVKGFFVPLEFVYLSLTFGRGFGFQVVRVGKKRFFRH